MRNSIVFGFIAMFVAGPLNGCTFGPPPHVVLRVPSSDAPAVQRVAAYSALAPRDIGILNGATLNNGTKVEYAEDLLTVVPPESATAHAVARANTRKWVCGISGSVALLSFVSAAAVGMADLAENGDRGDGNEHDSAYDRPLLALSALWLVSSAVGIYFCTGAGLANKHAFSDYDASLRQQLHVCVNGLQVVDCGGAPTAR